MGGPPSVSFSGDDEEDLRRPPPFTGVLGDPEVEGPLMPGPGGWKPYSRFIWSAREPRLDVRRSTLRPTLSSPSTPGSPFSGLGLKPSAMSQVRMVLCGGLEKPCCGAIGRAIEWLLHSAVVWWCGMRRLSVSPRGGVAPRVVASKAAELLP